MNLITGLDALVIEDDCTSNYHQIQEIHRDSQGRVIRLYIYLTTHPFTKGPDRAEAHIFTEGRWELLHKLLKIPKTVGEAQMSLLAAVGTILDWPDSGYQEKNA